MTENSKQDKIAIFISQRIIMKKILSMAIFSLAAMTLTAHAEQVKTSSGVFTINGEKLSFQGKPIPLGEEIMYVNAVKTFVVGGKETVLFSQSSGGTACPATYFFVNIADGKAQKGKDFGTCSDIPVVKQIGDKVEVTMPKSTGKGKVKYVYENGAVKEIK